MDVLAHRAAPQQPVLLLAVLAAAGGVLDSLEDFPDHLFCILDCLLSAADLHPALRVHPLHIPHGLLEASERLETAEPDSRHVFELQQRERHGPRQIVSRRVLDRHQDIWLPRQARIPRVDKVVTDPENRLGRNHIFGPVSGVFHLCRRRDPGLL